MFIITVEVNKPYVRHPINLIKRGRSQLCHTFTSGLVLLVSCLQGEREKEGEGEGVRARMVSPKPGELSLYHLSVFDVVKFY